MNLELFTMSTELLQRTKQFARRVLKASKTIEGIRGAVQRNAANQLARWGTSAVAYYCAAKRARSDAEFISKLRQINWPLSFPSPMNNVGYSFTENTASLKTTKQRLAFRS